MNTNWRLRLLFVLLVALLSGWRQSGICSSRASTGIKPPNSKTTRKAKLTPAQKQAAKIARTINTGKKLFNANECKACHSIEGDGCKDGPQLDGIGTRRTKAFIIEQLQDPEAHARKHASEFGNDPNMMPDMQLSKRDIDALALYLMSVPKRTTESAPKDSAPTEKR